MKKATKYRIWMMVIQLLFVAGAVVYCGPEIFQHTEKWLTCGLLLVGIILICIFKDAMKRYVQNISAFKICIFVAILSGVSLLLGKELLIISLATIAGGVCALPINVMYMSEIRPPTNQEMIEQLNSLKEDLKND